MIRFLGQDMICLAKGAVPGQQGIGFEGLAGNPPGVGGGGVRPGIMEDTGREQGKRAKTIRTGTYHDIRRET